MSVEIQTMGEGGIFEIAAVVIDEVLEIQPFTDVEYEILSSARDILAEGSILEAATVATNSANTAAGLASEAASAANDAAGLANSATTSANTAAGLASEAASAANDAAGLANSATTSANTAAGAANSAATSATSAAGAANTAASSANSAASAANTAAATAASFVGTGPAGYYATLTALQAAYPTGDTGIYVELEYGHWYYWSGSAWIDGGLFQAPLAVVQTTGTSETDVMSQKAVSDYINFYNVTNQQPLSTGEFYTFATAIAAVPVAARKLGLFITFRASAYEWETYQYRGATTDAWDWTDDSLWHRVRNHDVIVLAPIPIDFDFINRVVKFSQWEYSYVFYDGVVYKVPKNIQIDITAITGRGIIYFNTETKAFSAANTNYSVTSPNNIPIALIDAVRQGVTCSAKYTINNKPMGYGDDSKGDSAVVIMNGYANFDLVNKTLTFPTDLGRIRVYCHGIYTSITPGAIVNLPADDAEGKIAVNMTTGAVTAYKRTMSPTSPDERIIGGYNYFYGHAYLYGRHTINGLKDNYAIKELQTDVENALSTLAQDVAQANTSHGLTFGFITDIHLLSGFPAVLAAGLRRLYALAKFAKYTSLDFVVNGGDLLSGEVTVAADISLIAKGRAAQRDCFPLTDNFMIQGNHDGSHNNWNTIIAGGGTPAVNDVVTEKTWFNLTQKDLLNNGVVFDAANEAGGYFYKDYDRHKIRVIVLNVVDVFVLDSNGNPKYNPMYSDGVRQGQVDWLVNHALNFSAKTTPSDWGVVVFSHMGIDIDNSAFRGCDFVEAILQAFKNGTSVMTSYGAGDFAISVDHDFTAQGAMDYIAFIHGHTHTDRIVYNNDVPHISTAASFQDTDEVLPSGATLPLPRTGDTINEHCFDVFVVNRAARTIAIKRFGAGSNRTATF